MCNNFIWSRRWYICIFYIINKNYKIRVVNYICDSRVWIIKLCYISKYVFHCITSSSFCHCAKKLKKLLLYARMDGRCIIARKMRDSLGDSSLFWRTKGSSSPHECSEHRLEEKYIRSKFMTTLLFIFFWYLYWN